MQETERLVSLGDNFEISLEENPTTGYVWDLSFDDQFLELLTKVHRRKSQLIGAGGKTEFTFKTRKKGTTMVEFRLARPWEGEAIKSMSLKIVIS